MKFFIKAHNRNKYFVHIEFYCEELMKGCEQTVNKYCFGFLQSAFVPFGRSVCDYNI